MKQKEPVTISLLKTIVRNYPSIPSHLIHSAGREHCLSGGQRLRELVSKYGHLYTYSDHKYSITWSKVAMRNLLMCEKIKRGLK